MTPSESGNAEASSPGPHSRILVAVAFDPTGDQALQEGMRLATRASSCELHVVHAVTSYLSGIAAMQETDAQLERAPQLLRERVEQAWQHSVHPAIGHIRPGDPAAVILQVAIDIDADLVVVGSHRRTGVRKLVLGSVAERVLHAAHCPVLVAVPKNYAGDAYSPGIEPPCEQCLVTRRASGNARLWCERHAKPYLQPHLYVPRGEERVSVFPSL